MLWVKASRRFAHDQGNPGVVRPLPRLPKREDPIRMP